MEFFKIRRTIPFMRHALVFNIISLISFLAAVFFLAHNGLNFSIEFTGGTLIEVGYKQPADVEKVRQALDKAGYKSEVQNFGSSREVLIRMHLEKNQSSADLSQKVLQVLKEQEQSAELRRVEFVGPQVGKELAEYGALALLVTAVGIVLYLWMRFEWRFGLSAIIANLHDVVIILGCFALAFTIGICFGIYSSVLVASPLLMWRGAKRDQFIKPTRKERGRDEHEGAVV